MSEHIPDIRPDGPASVDLDIEQYPEHDVYTITAKVTSENAIHTVLGKSMYAIVDTCEKELQRLIRNGCHCDLCGSDQHIVLTCPRYADICSEFGSLCEFVRQRKPAPTRERARKVVYNGRKYYVIGDIVYEHRVPVDSVAAERHGLRFVPCKRGRGCTHTVCTFLHPAYPHGNPDAYKRIVDTAHRRGRPPASKPDDKAGLCF